MSLSSASSACWTHRPCNEIQDWREEQQHTPGHDWGCEAPVLSWLELLWSPRLSQGLAVEQLKLDCGNDSFKIALQVFLKIHLHFFFLVSLILASDSPDRTGTPTGSIHVCALTQSASRGLGGAGRAAEIMAAWFTQMLSPTWRVHLCVWLQ